MKRKTTKQWKLYVQLAVLLVIGVQLAACGTKKEVWETPAAEAEASIEAVLEETQTEEDVMETQQESVTETATETVTEEELKDTSWIEPYRELLSDHEQLMPLLQEQNEGGSRGFISGFYLYDIDQNGIPELLVQKYQTADYIYTCVDGKVQLRNTISYDSFCDSLIAYDRRDGKLYYFTLDGGTGTGRITRLNEMYLLEEGNGQRGYDVGQTALYSATYGGLEQDDGSYLELEWEEALPDEGSVISKEKFEDIVDHLTPVLYQEINEENMTKYLQADYDETDLYQNCTLEDYRAEMAARQAEFEENVLEIQVDSDVQDENVLTKEEYDHLVYFDLERLACYHEREVKYVYEEEWKNIYREWLTTLDQQGEEYGIQNLNKWELQNMSFNLTDWKEGEAPVLSFYCNEDTQKYFWIENGKVTQFHELGGGPVSLMEGVSFVKGTNCFLSFSSFGSVVQPFSSIEVYQWDTSGVTYCGGVGAQYDAEIGALTSEDYSIQDNNVSQAEFVAYMDSLLGAGVGSQMVNRVLGSVLGSDMDTSLSLTFAENIGFTYSELDATLSSF